jgi:tRNA(Arg) A34 adenosine deaminase TadA
MSNGFRQHLRRAIELAQQACDHGNHPFGALLVDRRGNVVLEAENTVRTDRDVTAHAETNLMRMASARFEPDFLERCTLYTSTEPCAMCAGAGAHLGRSGPPRGELEDREANQEVRP